MYPRGTIYKSGKSPETNTIFLHAPLIMKFIFGSLRSFGAFLIFACLIYAFYCLGPVAKEEVVYSASRAIAKINPEPSPSALPEAVENNSDAEKTALVQHEAKELGLSSDFSVYIPKINAKSQIIPNVDPGNFDQYMTALKEGVAHTKGTNFPGEGKLIYLFSHSTNSPLWGARYGAVFYLLSKMQPQDKITIFFADKKYEYSVEKTLVVGPNDTSWLIDQAQGEKLILQTCTPAGTSLRRLLVIAKPSV